MKRATDVPQDILAEDFAMTAPSTPGNIQLEWIRTEFNLPQSMARLCTQYFLRIWTGSYVTESVQDGILHGRSDDWIVHWQSTPEVVKNARQVACSFREYNGKKYVVVKVWQGQQTQEQGE